MGNAVININTLLAERQNRLEQLWKYAEAKHQSYGQVSVNPLSPRGVTRDIMLIS